MTAAELVALGPGRFGLRGELDFTSVCVLLPQGLEAFATARSLVLDLQKVTRANSAGVALLLEWVERARERGVELRFANVPEALEAMVRMSHVEDLLPLAPE
jgi:phospholipid transport system transporter-binding protein